MKRQRVTRGSRIDRWDCNKLGLVTKYIEKNRARSSPRSSSLDFYSLQCILTRRGAVLFGVMRLVAAFVLPSSVIVQ